MGARLTLAELARFADAPTLRAAAIEAMGRSGDPIALGPLTAALDDTARSVREAGIRALAALHARLEADARRRVEQSLVIGPGAHHALVEALLGGTLGVQRAAALVLGISRREDAVRPLTLALGDAELREAAMHALGLIGADAVEELVALVPDLEGALRADVYTLLGRSGALGPETRVQALLADALDDEDAEAAAAAATALGEIGGKAQLAHLLRALEREEPVASAAAAALGHLGARYYDEVRILVSSRGLGGPDAPYLCRILGACGRPGDAAFLRSALGADDKAVRRAAADALGQLPPTPRATDVDEALLFALADESPEVRAAAARALGAHAQLLAVGPLERAAHDSEAQVRAAAARALGDVARAATGDERVGALGQVRRLATGVDVVAAVPALEALGQIADPTDDPLLVTAIASADAEVVKAAARALGGRHDDGAARAALARALTDARWDVRRAAALALAEHGAAGRALLDAHRAVERDPLVLEAIAHSLAGSV
jgi:HEAT repeat protein